MSPETQNLKQVETKRFSITLTRDEDFRFVVKYKNGEMEAPTSLSFSDLKFASQVFDDTLIKLEGH